MHMDFNSETCLSLPFIRSGSLWVDHIFTSEMEISSEVSVVCNELQKTVDGAVTLSVTSPGLSGYMLHFRNPLNMLIGVIDCGQPQQVSAQ